MRGTGPFFLGVVPARGGSKGIKDKNLRTLAGKPLIAYTIEAANASVELGDCLVSTDSERIAGVAKEFGASVPFLRPAELARDESPTVDALVHAVHWYEREHGTRIHAVVVLQPTAPLRTVQDIDESIRLFKEGGARSLFSCYEEHSAHPVVMYVEEDGLLKPLMGEKDVVMRRQDFPPVYVRNGAVYISERDLVLEERRIRDDRSLLYLMPRERSINIDEIRDFEEVERFLGSQASKAPR